MTAALAIPVLLMMHGLSDEFCIASSAHLSVAKQDGLEDFPIMTRQGKGMSFTIVAYEGEPLLVGVSMSVGRYQPPSSGLQVLIRNSGSKDVLSSIEFKQWTRHGDPSSYEGADYAGGSKQFFLGPFRAGSYELVPEIEGCPSKYPGRSIHLEVRAVRTNLDRANLHAYRANRVADDCAAALKEVEIIERNVPGTDAALRIRTACADRAGDLEAALAGWDELERRMKIKREQPKPPDLHYDDNTSYEDSIAKVRKKIRERERGAPPAKK